MYGIHESTAVQVVTMSESGYPEMVTSTSTPGSKLMLVCMKDNCVSANHYTLEGGNSYDLLDDLAGGVQVNEALVDLELVTIPGLGTLTTRLKRGPEHERST